MPGRASETGGRGARAETDNLATQRPQAAPDGGEQNAPDELTGRSLSPVSARAGPKSIPTARAQTKAWCSLPMGRPGTPIEGRPNMRRGRWRQPESDPLFKSDADEVRGAWGPDRRPDLGLISFAHYLAVELASAQWPAAAPLGGANLGCAATIR